MAGLPTSGLMSGSGVLANIDWQAPQRALVSAQGRFESWSQLQAPAVLVGIETLKGSTQGAVLGGVMGTITKMDPEGIAKLMQPPPGASPNPGLLRMQTQSPFMQARNFAVMTGVQSGLSLAIKQARGGVEDVRGAMGAAFGSGAAFSLVSGVATGNPFVGAFNTGVLFALLQGGLYQLSKKFGDKNPKEKDLNYVKAKHLLETVGFPNYAKNLHKAHLDDRTIMLWNESALQQANIPPGPRLLILHHVDSFREALKPGLPADGKSLSS